MPIFYNPNGPTPTTANNINNVSINIRDFLLNQNISSTYPSISTAINGSPHVGQPVLDTESNHLNFFPHQQLNTDTTTLDVLGSVLNGQGVGIGNNGSLVPNFDVRSSLAGRVLGATGLLNDTKIGTIGAQQLALALANNAIFNTEQSLLGSLNVQDNLIALVKGNPLPGFRPNYKITVPSSTGGKILNTASQILGFTIPRSYLSDDGSIFQTENHDAENIDRANAMLLNTGKGQALALITNSKANLEVNTNSNSPFRSGYAPAFTNNSGDYANNSIGTDAKLYAYDDGQGHFVHLLSSNEGNGVIPNLTINRERKTIDSGFKSPDELYVGPKGNSGYNQRVLSDVGFTWSTNTGGATNNIADYDLIEGDKKSLLVKTQKLFSSVGMKSIVTTKGDMNQNSTQISQANGGGFSKGNAVMKKELFSNGVYSGGSKTADETYCRSWTTLNRYDRVNRLVRSGADSITDGIDESGKNINGLYGKNQIPFRETNGGSVNSILDKYGFPKISPYIEDNAADPKKYMFSIENLAWADRTDDLPVYEVGPGDLINNKKGRIMWFPPYDISFTENSTVNWESSNFIGRGEPVYTYNNTERSGTLSFKVVVDHPSYANAFRGNNGPDDHYVNSFWAGCIPPELGDRLSISEETKLLIETVEKPQKITPQVEPAPDVKLVVYFPNDTAAIPPFDYESGMSGSSSSDNIDYDLNPNGDGYGINLYPAQYTSGAHKAGDGWYDNTNYGLNGTSIWNPSIVFEGNEYKGWNDRVDLLLAINNYMTEKCPHCIVEVTGFASQQGVVGSNKKLVKDRAKNIIDELKLSLFNDMAESDKNARFKYIEGDIEISNTSCKVGDEAAIDKISCKKDRRAEITFKFDENLVSNNISNIPTIKETTKKQITTRITNRLYDETMFFNQLTDADPFVFDRFREKIKYFHPAFHSTTPEGLNSRLTFLLQCTRQGPTSEAQNVNNLAFGRPPVCILRIGDFYNTKIVMDNVSIDYDPLVWDLNPEGIGVQPMIANVNISFKFIGGSSLMGPINKLQNALSFNYFANTQVYDPRADYITKDAYQPTKQDKDGNTNDLPNYVNVHGVTTLKNANSTDIKIVDLPTNVSDVDQKKGQENNLKGVEVKSLSTPMGSIDDKLVISNILLKGYMTYNFDNVSVNPVFTFSTNTEVTTLNLDSTVAKTYKGQIYIKNITNNLVTNLGYVSVRSNGDNNGVVFTSGTGEEVILSPDVNGTVEWNVVLDLNDTQNKVVAEAIKLPNSVISLEWETTSKNNINFSETNGF
jgi:hypothetical protein